MKNKLLALIAFALLAGSARADKPEPLTVVVHVNIITWETDWVSSGAIKDSGVIGLDENMVRFIGSPNPNQVGLEKVFGPIVGNDGSKIYWTFVKVYFPTSDPDLWVTKASWHIVEGTGKYLGLKGEGSLDGDINFVTGIITDVFTGQVQFPKK